MPQLIFIYLSVINAAIRLQLYTKNKIASSFFTLEAKLGNFVPKRVHKYCNYTDTKQKLRRASSSMGVDTFVTRSTERALNQYIVHSMNFGRVSLQ